MLTRTNRTDDTPAAPHYVPELGRVYLAALDCPAQTPNSPGILHRLIGWEVTDSGRMPVVLVAPNDAVRTLTQGEPFEVVPSHLAAAFDLDRWQRAARETVRARQRAQRREQARASLLESLRRELVVRPLNDPTGQELMRELESLGAARLVDTDPDAVGDTWATAEHRVISLGRWPHLGSDEHAAFIPCETGAQLLIYSTAPRPAWASRISRSPAGLYPILGHLDVPSQPLPVCLVFALGRPVAHAAEGIWEETPSGVTVDLAGWLEMARTRAEDEAYPAAAMDLHTLDRLKAGRALRPQSTHEAASLERLERLGWCYRLRDVYVLVREI